MIIRAVTIDDADAAGAVHVAAWRGAYRGIMPDDFLDGLVPSARAESWRRWVAEPSPGVSLVLAEDDSTVCGVAAFGPARDAAGEASVGEVYSLNLDPSHWRRGIGTALLQHAECSLAADGRSSAVLWVATGNTRARDFYERLGWVADGAHRSDVIGGVDVPVVRYRRSLAPDLLADVLDIEGVGDQIGETMSDQKAAGTVRG